MGAIIAFGFVAALVVIPVMTLGTLAVCAVWNRIRRPENWQVLVVATLASFVPLLLSSDFDIVGSLVTSLPVLVPAGLWALSRANEDGEHTRAARLAASLLVGWIVFIIVVLPALFVGFVWYFGRDV